MASTSVPQVFLSCHFPPSERAQTCVELSDAIGLKMVMADAPRPVQIQQKVREKIREAEAFVLLWEDSSEEEDVSSRDWLVGECGHAQALGLPVGVIMAAARTPLPRNLPRDLEYVNIDPLQTADTSLVRLVRYLRGLRDSLLSGQDPFALSFIREDVKNRLTFYDDATLFVETNILVRALRTPVPELRHSLHLNYKHFLHDVDGTPEIPIELVQEAGSRRCRLVDVNRSANRFSFGVAVDPPLQSGERISFGWRTPRCQYSHSRNDLVQLYPVEDNLLLSSQVEHHWYVNHPTERLQISATFPAAMAQRPVSAVSLVGRLFRKASIDTQESDRIRSSLHEERFLDTITYTATVDNPLLGNTYAITYFVETDRSGNTPERTDP